MDKQLDTGTAVEGEITMSKAEIAWEMMLAGRSSYEICQTLDYNNAKDITRAIQEQLKREATFVDGDDRKKLLGMSLARYDKLRAAVWPAAMMGDPQSVDKAIKIEQAYMKALGTDIPDTQTGQQTVLVIGGQEASYVEKLKGMLDGPSTDDGHRRN